ncbi:MAG: hypothetical protein WCS42_25145, partial [Verrucomicrobiota bacterium]
LAPARTGQSLQTATGENTGNRHLIRPAATFSPFEAERGVAPATVDLLTADLDAWFAKNNRGELTAHIEVYPIDGEFWFLIRHGDAFARTTKLTQRKSEVLHFRPAKDDVVVYAPKRDEIRIHAGTKGERELYRTAFGLRLFGDDNYFCNRKTLSLEPLRLLGIDALDVSGIAGLDKVVARELEIAFDNKHHESVIRRADDLFAAAADAPFERAAIPAGGRLVRATFDFYFTGSKSPRTVQVKPSNTLKLGRHCDARIVHEFLAERSFRCFHAGDNASRTGQNGDTLSGLADPRLGRPPSPQRGEGNITQVGAMAAGVPAGEWW